MPQVVGVFYPCYLPSSNLWYTVIGHWRCSALETGINIMVVKTGQNSSSHPRSVMTDTASSGARIKGIPRL